MSSELIMNGPDNKITYQVFLGSACIVKSNFTKDFLYLLVSQQLTRYKGKMPSKWNTCALYSLLLKR